MVDLKDIMLTAHSLRKPLPPAILALLPPDMLRKKKRSVEIKNPPSIRELNVFRSELSISLPPAVVAAVAASIKAAFHDPYGDRDQTPLQGTKCEPLRSARSSSLDFHESVIQDWRGSPLHRLAYFGDYDLLHFSIRHAKAAGGHQLVWEMMEVRCSMLRLNALAYAVLGSQHARRRFKQLTPERRLKQLTPELMPEKEPPGRWEECLELLIASGANCNARDIAGYPVMALAVDGQVAETTKCRFALLLAEAGADLNVRTRFGEPILLLALLDVLQSLENSADMMSGATKQKLELYEVLVGLGADPDIQDPNGLTPRAAVNSISAQRASILKAVRQNAIDEKTCASCSKMLAKMRCKKCFAVFYCGKECQIRDWTNHKPKCAQVWQDFFVDVDTDKKKMGCFSPNPDQQVTLSGKHSDVGKVFVVSLCSRRAAGSKGTITGLPERPISVDDSIKIVLNNGQEVGDAIFPCIADAAGNFYLSTPQFREYSKRDTSESLHDMLVRLSQAETSELAPDGRFYSARWQPPVVEGGPVTVLRICYAKALAAPKSFQRAKVSKC